MDILHGLVVDQICNITMEDKDEIDCLNLNTFDTDTAWCRLLLFKTNVNVASYLVENDFVSRSPQSGIPRKMSHKQKLKLDLENFCKMEDQLLNVNAKFLEGSNDSVNRAPHEEFHIGDGLDISRFEHLSDESFNPQVTSSHFDTTEQREPIAVVRPEEIHAFPPFDLKQLPDKFYATVLNVVGPRTLQIRPNLLSNRNFSVFERKLASLSRLESKTQKLKTVKPKALCIAYLEPEQKYGRAMVGEVDEASKTAKVYFVDYLKSQDVPFDKLSECPSDIQKLPVLWINVELTNILASKNMRSRDLLKKLHDEMHERYIYCVVTRINTADANEAVGVLTYEDDTCTKLVYENLIKEKYYYKPNEETY